MIKVIAKYKNYILGLIAILLVLTLSIGMKYIMKPKYKELPEVKLKEIIEKDKAMAIMVSNDGNNYEEYEKNSWPGVEYKFREAKCVNEDGKIVENALSFDKEKRKANLKIKETIYCTLYFDYFGTGEQNDPYKIQYIEDLVDLSNLVNNGETYAGKYFELERNLDFNKESDYRNYKTKEYGDINGNSTDEELKTELTTEKGWKPIGNLTYKFSGIFDGKDKRIDNLIINHTVPNGTTEIFLGLFGVVNNDTIKNLTIGGEINIIPNYSITGGIIGRATNAEIINCHNEVNITSQASGYSNGGLLGDISSIVTIKDSSNIGNISGGGTTGGLVGINNGTLTIENSHNKGNVTNTKGANVGGLIGRDYTDTNITTIKNSYNEGTIVSNVEEEKETRTGGLISSVVGTINIDKSYNSGEVRNDKKTYTQNLNISLGGLIGQINGNNKNVNKITNSYNEGHLIGATKQAGIIGFHITNAITIIDKCYNKGTIESQIIVGGWQTAISGIVGYNNNSSKLYVLNSYNEGNISSIRYASSICYNDKGAQTYIINSYNTGTINGSLASGGLFTVSSTDINNINLNNCYNLGKLEGDQKYEIFYRYGTTAIIDITNVYYSNTGLESNVENIIGNPMPLSDMKNNTFVDTLNTNKNSIDLSSIDSNLSEYTLCNWKMGKSGYPELAC